MIPSNNGGGGVDQIAASGIDQLAAATDSTPSVLYCIYLFV
jgi:hypothetical protein